MERRRAYISRSLSESIPSSLSDADLSCSKYTEAECTLDEKLRDIDESFSEMLLRKIDEKGMTDAECYKKANVSKQTKAKGSTPGFHPQFHFQPTASQPKM